MRNDPGLDIDRIAACLRAQYGLDVSSVTFLPIGFDLDAAVYRATTRDRQEYFIKVRSGPVQEPPLQIPRALIDAGIHNVVAPLRTLASTLWCALDGDDGSTVVVYPFIRGESAMETGLTRDEWRQFGAAMKAIHTSGIGNQYREQLRVESFALPSAALVRQILTLRADEVDQSPAAASFAAFLRAHSDRICRMLDRAEALGRSLQPRRWEMVLCHGDIHAANILVGEDSRIWLVDWDAPLIAPRERDLLFVVGSRIAREVTPAEEDYFFEGYGPTGIVPEALVYYRYERVIEDIGEFGKSILLAPGISEQSREEQAAMAAGFFAADGDIARAESVARYQWPRPRS
jgi:spectinomycin phosphotransferase